MTSERGPPRHTWPWSCPDSQAKEVVSMPEVLKKRRSAGDKSLQQIAVSALISFLVQIAIKVVLLIAFRHITL